MAILQLGGLVTGIRGSVGGSNFYKSQFGTVLRTKSNRKTSLSKTQATTLSFWSRSVSFAKGTSESDLKGIVNEFAKNMLFSKNGHTYTLSPFQWLVAFSSLRLRCGLEPALPSGQPQGRLDIPAWWVRSFIDHGDVDIIFPYVLPANIYAFGSMTDGLNGGTPGKPTRFPGRNLCPPGTDNKLDFAPRKAPGTNTVYFYFRLLNATGSWTPLIRGKHTWLWEGL